MQEAGTGFASKPQTDDAEPGDIALDSWVRYDDPEVRTFKYARYVVSNSEFDGVFVYVSNSYLTHRLTIN